MAARTFSEPISTSGAWSTTFRAWYRLLRLVERPLVRLTLRRGFGNLVVMRVPGRRSGQARITPLGLLTVGEGRYLGHPSGDSAWTRNVRAAGVVEIESAGVGPVWVRAMVLEPGAERDAVVRASFRQHPFPGNAMYRLAGSHVAATGVFFRLQPAPGRGQ